MITTAAGKSASNYTARAHDPLCLYRKMACTMKQIQWELHFKEVLAPWWHIGLEVQLEQIWSTLQCGWYGCLQFLKGIYTLR